MLDEPARGNHYIVAVGQLDDFFQDLRGHERK